MEKDLYRIQYVDNTFQLVEWNVDQLALVYTDINNGKKVTMIDRCIFRLDDIRAIVYLPPVEPDAPVPEDKGEPIVVTEMGAYERDMYELLMQNGIDVGNVIGYKGGEPE